MSISTLNQHEQEIANQYTSELYGIIWGHEHIDTLAFLWQMAKFYEDYLPNVQASDLPNVFLYIGHWNLLLNHFPKALSAYTVAIRQNPNLATDPLFLFGIGISYFYYGVYDRSLDAFQRLYWTNSLFPRTADVLIRIALVLKHYGAYDLSEKYYKLINSIGQDSHSLYCSFTKSEILLSLGHMYQLKEEHDMAQHTFEMLIRTQTDLQAINPSLRLRLMKQITCLLHNLPDDEAQRFLENSFDFISQLINCSSESPMVYYYAGRCLAIANRINEAFFKYRNCVDRMQNGADVWCSIGNLYQHQNQLNDALQAYVCSLQIETNHFESWFNVGVLYEGVNQIRDAISSYAHACSHCKDELLKKKLMRRVELLRAYQSTIGILAARQTLPGIGPSGLPGSVSSTNLPQLSHQENLSEACPLDQQAIQGIRSLIERRCTQVPTLGHLSVVPANAILPYVQPNVFQKRIIRSLDVPSSEEQIQTIPLLQRHADINEKNLILPNQSIMWIQFGQVFRLRLQYASTGQIVAAIPSQQCTVTTQPSIGYAQQQSGSSCCRIFCKHIISNVSQFARYQANSCIRLTNTEETVQQVSFAWVCPAPVQIEHLLCRSLPICVCPNQANNLLSYCSPYGKCGLFLLVPGVRLPAHTKPYTIVYFNVGPGEIHWKIVQGKHHVDILNEQMRKTCGADCLDGTNDLWPKYDGASSIIQRSGDLLIIAPNSIHWATSLGWANCLRWGISPFKEFKLLHQDYERGMLRQRSVPSVPLQRLSLTLARDCHFTSSTIYQAVLQVLLDHFQMCGKCLICESEVSWVIQTEVNESTTICDICKQIYANDESPWWSDLNEVIERFRLYIPILNFKE